MQSSTTTPMRSGPLKSLANGTPSVGMSAKKRALEGTPASRAAMASKVEALVNALAERDAELKRLTAEQQAAKAALAQAEQQALAAGKEADALRAEAAYNVRWTIRLALPILCRCAVLTT